MGVKFLPKDHATFIITSQPWFADLAYIGEINLINSSLLAIFSSAQCPASSILKAHEYAQEIRNGGMGVVSGFHAPAEKEVLEVLLKGTCPLVIVLGRRLEGARIPAVWKTEIERGRMLVISPFKEYQKRVTKEISVRQNDLAAHLAGRVLIVHASEGGSLEGQVERWREDGVELMHLSE